MYNIQDYVIVRESSTTVVRSFLAKNHYIKALPRGCRYVYAFYLHGVLTGVACYGYPVGTNVQKQYGNNVMELKRFALASGCPKNTCSWLLSRCFKLLKIDGVRKIISYADPEQGHEGTMYRASNFKYMGQQVQGTRFIKWKGKKVYGRNLSDVKIEKYDELRKKIDKGELKVKYMKRKHIFLYGD